MATVTISQERLAHFRCSDCKGWWSIGDAPIREHWFCPWCGKELTEWVENPIPNKYRLATDIVRDIWIRNQKMKPKITGLNGAMGSFIRSGTQMSFDEFLAKLRDRDNTLLAMNGIGHRSVEVLREYFNDALPADAVRM